MLQKKEPQAPNVVEAVSPKLRKAFDAVLATEEGRILWSELAQELGFFAPLLTTVNAEVAPLATEARAAQRLAYLRLRMVPSYDRLAVAEALADPAAPKLNQEEERKK